MLLAGLTLSSIDFESAEIRVETREEEDGINEVMKSQREAVKAEQQINSDNKKIIENLHSQLEKAQLEVSMQHKTIQQLKHHGKIFAWSKDPQQEGTKALQHQGKASGVLQDVVDKNKFDVPIKSAADAPTEAATPLAVQGDVSLGFAPTYKGNRTALKKQKRGQPSKIKELPDNMVDKRKSGGVPNKSAADAPGTARDGDNSSNDTLDRFYDGMVDGPQIDAASSAASCSALGIAKQPKVSDSNDFFSLHGAVKTNPHFKLTNKDKNMFALNKGSKTRAAACLAGKLDGFGVTYFQWLHGPVFQLLKDYGVDLFSVVSTGDAYAYWGDFLNSLDPVAAVVVNQTSIMNTSQSWLYQEYADPSHSGAVNVDINVGPFNHLHCEKAPYLFKLHFLQFWQFQKCRDLIQAQEKKQGFQYKAVFRLRPDVALYANSGSNPPLHCFEKGNYMKSPTKECFTATREKQDQQFEDDCAKPIFAALQPGAPPGPWGHIQQDSFFMGNREYMMDRLQYPLARYAKANKCNSNMLEHPDEHHLLKRNEKTPGKCNFEVQIWRYAMDANAIYFSDDQLTGHGIHFDILKDQEDDFKGVAQELYGSLAKSEQHNSLFAKNKIPAHWQASMSRYPVPFLPDVARCMGVRLCRVFEGKHAQRYDRACHERAAKEARKRLNNATHKLIENVANFCWEFTGRAHHCCLGKGPEHCPPQKAL
jgi:hypothetical protein